MTTSGGPKPYTRRFENRASQARSARKVVRSGDGKFSLPEKDNAKVSRLIKSGITVIKVFDPEVGAKARSYVPYYARTR